MLPSIALTTVAITTLLYTDITKAQITFDNVSDTHLIGAIESESWGLSVGDLEGDNWPDIFVTNHRNRSSLFQNNGNGKFVNNILQRDTGRSWLGVRYDDTHGAAWGDFDNDGDDDLVVGTNAAAFHFLMISDGEDFQNDSLQRLGEDTSSSYSLWFDIDKDGRSDLFQGRDSGDLSVYFRQQASNGIFDPSTARPGCEGDWAFLTDVTDDNVSDLICAREGGFPTGAFDISTGTFQDITSSIPSLSSIVDGIAADLNNDLKSDLIFVRGAISASHATQHNSRLIEIAADTGSDEVVSYSFQGGGNLNLQSWSPPVVRESKSTNTSTTVGGFTVNRNAATDTWTIERTSSGWEYAYLQIRSSSVMRNLRILQTSQRDKTLSPEIFWQQNGGWVNRTSSSGMRIPMDCKSIIAADFDNDMDQDLFMACGQGTRNIPNRLFANNGFGVFTEVPNAAGAGGVTGAPFADAAGSSESVASGDFNNDGFIDLFVVNGNNSQPVRGRYGKSELMLNNSASNGNNNHWIELNLIGTTSSSSASGTRVIATAGNVSQLREVGANYHRWTQNDDRVHFGLRGNRTVNLQVIWKSGLIENFNGIAADRLYDVVEGTGITAVNITAPESFPAPTAGDECGTPGYFPDMDSGLFLYRNCNNGRWSIRSSAAAGRSFRYDAGLTSNNPINVHLVGSLESADSIDTSNASSITFNFLNENSDSDGFDFDIPANHDACLALNSPMAEDLRVMLGGNHLPISLPFNLDTLQSCNGTQVPVLSVSDAVVNEGDQSANFQVSLSPANPNQTVTVRAAAQILTGTPGLDYYGFATTLTFAPNETSKLINVTILDDQLEETEEKLGVRLYNASNADIGDGVGEMRIVDNDGGTGPTPTLSINDVWADEFAGTGTLTISLEPANNTEVVTVSAAASQTGSATQGLDYYGFFNTYTFAPGETEKEVSVTIIDDNVSGEGNETLGVRLVAPDNAVFGDRNGVIIIRDDD